ncbi:MAG: class II aldolase/adducin family protein [Planctomycetes bacterium]|nr:class II aldolase/adducin family protein [Planctomycetota bacterium]
MTTGFDARAGLAALRMQLAHYARRTYERGFVAATDGNLSARSGTGTILISPSGSSLGELAPEDFVEIDARGALAGASRGRSSSERSPSSEYRMHLAVYAERPDVQAVLHAHPPYAVGFSIAGRAIADNVLPEVIVGLGTIPAIPYTTPTTAETAEAVGRAIRRRDAVILEHHGTVTVGTTIQVAYQRLEKVEHAAQIAFIANQLGNVRQLPRAEVAKLLRMREEQGLPPLAPLGDP